MASERLPTHELSAVERVKRENRPDLPLGFSSSLIVHASLAALFAGVLATAYVEAKLQQPKEQPSQVITIETLVRPQPVAVQQPQQMVRQTLQRTVTQQVQSTSSQRETPQVKLLTAQQANPSTQGSASNLSTFAVLQGSAGKHHAKKRKNTPDENKPAAQQSAVTANTGAQSASTSTTIYTAPNNGNSAADDDAAAGGYMSPGRGPVWSEQRPTGPGGNGGDSCAPSRGGFISHLHLHRN